MLSVDAGPPPPLTLPKVDDPEARALIDAAIAAGRITVCPGFGEGAIIEHYDNRHDGLTGAERHEARKEEGKRLTKAASPKRKRDKQIVEDYRAGMLVTKIMAKHGLKAVQSVRYIIKRDAPEIMQPRGRPASAKPAPKPKRAPAAPKPATPKPERPKAARHGRQRDSGKGGEALKLRGEGMSWPAIAEALGYAAAKGAAKEAKKHAERHGQPWPPA